MGAWLNQTIAEGGRLRWAKIHVELRKRHRVVASGFVVASRDARNSPGPPTLVVRRRLRAWTANNALPEGRGSQIAIESFWAWRRAAVRPQETAAARARRLPKFA